MVENHKSKISIDAGINAQHLEAQHLEARIWSLLVPHYEQDFNTQVFCGYCEQEIKV
tara:strand:+ start:2243 stop:2413 length:171 start_codon:yes stop_codon:yes gene_type:complete